MKGLMFIFLIVSCAVALIVSVNMYRSRILSKVQPVPGVSIPWKPATYTYLGAPGIDTQAFYSIVTRREEAGGCILFTTKYQELSHSELMKLAATGNSEALTELVLRAGQGELLTDAEGLSDALKNASARKNVDANLLRILLDKNGSYKSRVDSLTEYEKYTPAAIYIKLLVMKKAGELPANKDIEGLITSGYPFLMASGVMLELDKKGTTNKDVFCEAYFMGCSILYDYKINYGINCN